MYSIKFYLKYIDSGYIEYKFNKIINEELQNKKLSFDEIVQNIFINEYSKNKGYKYLSVRILNDDIFYKCGININKFINYKLKHCKYLFQLHYLLMNMKLTQINKFKYKLILKLNEITKRIQKNNYNKFIINECLKMIN